MLGSCLYFDGLRQQTPAAPIQKGGGQDDLTKDGPAGAFKQ